MRVQLCDGAGERISPVRALAAVRMRPELCALRSRGGAGNLFNSTVIGTKAGAGFEGRSELDAGVVVALWAAGYSKT
jgi:hypothetical protein